MATVALTAPATGHSYPALQLLHATAPAMLKVPAPHIAAAGVALVDPAGHAYPALQLVHAVAPDTLNVPTAHIADVGVADVEPGEHA